MAIIKNFKANTYTRAFILNSLAITITVLTALFLKDEFEKIGKPKHEQVESLDSALVFATIGATFLSSLGTYYILYFLFGFGGGMMTTV
jgi:hypothetical protein